MWERARRATVVLLVAAAGAVAAGAVAAGPPQPPALDPAARRPEGPAPSEYWDLTARLASGHHLFARFAFTSLGPGERNAVAIGHLVFPDGRVHRFKNLVEESAQNLSPDGRTLHVNNSHLYLGALPHRLEITKRNTRFHLRFHPAAGHVPPASLTAGGYAFALLDPSAPLRGRLRHPEKLPGDGLDARGRAAFTHTWLGVPEPELLLRRLEFFSLADDGEPALHWTELLRADGTSARWLTVRHGDGARADTTEVALGPEGALATPTRPGYPLPGAIRIFSPRADGRVRLGRVLLEQDPIADLQELSWVVRLLIRPPGRPHRIWVEAPYELRLSRDDGPPRTVTGTGVLTASFFEPLPDGAAAP